MSIRGYFSKKVNGIFFVNAPQKKQYPIRDAAFFLFGGGDTDFTGLLCALRNEAQFTFAAQSASSSLVSGKPKESSLLANTQLQSHPTGWLSVEQYEIEYTYRQEKDEELLKFLVLFLDKHCVN